MTSAIEHAVFRVAEALQVPVLILALVALAIVLVDAGAFAVEVGRRRRRNLAALERAALAASEAVRSGNRGAALAAVGSVGTSAAMTAALARIVELARTPLSDERVAKVLADFDYLSLRRLERTRLLVRFGPALGLMGTLIPLSPALAALATGDTKRLANDLRVAFSITVLGLLVGAIAFGISLVRDRLYGQDLSDLQYVAVIVDAPVRSG